MSTFKDYSNAMYSIPKRFSDKEIPQCPICGSPSPSWLIANEQKLFFKYYKFKCSKCESILSISESDITGLSYTTKSFAGMYKKHQGKDCRKIYIKIEKVSLSISDMKIRSLQGAELSLEELTTLCQSDHKME